MTPLKPEIFVLNYNGSALMRECLPSILTAASKSPVLCPVTVIDNQSTDDSLEILKKDFPGVRIYISPKNTVLCAFNDAVKESEADVVLLLNNDLKADPDFVAPLLEVFSQHTDAFMAAPKTYTFDGKQYEGSLAQLYFRKGLPGCLTRFPGYEKKVDLPGYTTESGFGAFRRSFFLELGGYDPLYLPGTIEDLDLCYRAWKADHACYYVPESRMSHKGQATFKKSFGRAKILAINQRNLYLFVWKNIFDLKFLANHLLWFLIRPLWFLLQGRFEFLWGFLMAWGRLPEAIKRRGEQKKIVYQRTDAEVFKLLGAL